METQSKAYGLHNCLMPTGRRRSGHLFMQWLIVSHGSGSKEELAHFDALTIISLQLKEQQGRSWRGQIHI